MWTIEKIHEVTDKESHKHIVTSSVQQINDQLSAVFEKFFVNYNFLVTTTTRSSYSIRKGTYITSLSQAGRLDSKTSS